MAFSDTALQAYVKRTYASDYIENSMTSVSDSTLKEIKKETDGSGDNFSWLVDNDDQFVVAGDFGTAQAAATANTNTVGGKFLSDWNVLSGVAQIPSTISVWPVWARLNRPEDHAVAPATRSSCARSCSHIGLV